MSIRPGTVDVPLSGSNKMLPLLERAADADGGPPTPPPMDPPLIARCFSRPVRRGAAAAEDVGDGNSCCGDEGSATEDDVDEDAVDDVIEELSPVSFKDSDLNKPADPPPPPLPPTPAIAFCPVFKELKCFAGGTFANAL